MDIIRFIISKKKELTYFEGDKTLKRNIYQLEQEDFDKLKEQLLLCGVVKSLPIDEIQDYHIKRWANGLETGASMQEIREDMVMAKRAIDLGNTLKEREIKY